MSSLEVDNFLEVLENEKLGTIGVAGNFWFIVIDVVDVENNAKNLVNNNNKNVVNKNVTSNDRSFEVVNKILKNLNVANLNLGITNGLNRCSTCIIMIVVISDIKMVVIQGGINLLVGN